MGKIEIKSKEEELKYIKDEYAGKMESLLKTHLGGAVLRNPVREAVEDIYTDSGIIRTDEYKPFTKKMVVYGMTFAAPDKVSDGFMLKVAKTMKEMFPCTGEGIDRELQEKVLQNLYKYNALLPVVMADDFSWEESPEFRDTESRNSICDIIMEGDPRQTMEVVEHILHAVTDVGLHHVMPDDWGVTKTSKLYKSMQEEAISNGHYDVSGYDDFDDVPLEIKERVLIQEYAYWVITTVWNLQVPYGPDEKEWIPKTEDDLKTSLPKAYNLFKQTIPQIMASPSKATLDDF